MKAPQSNGEPKGMGSGEFVTVLSGVLLGVSLALHLVARLAA
jgi:hypothetical protein